ncbi:nuclease-related domain-containing protein [Thiomonas intermedia]|uniref:nuclease-related domain-containing protein n=1 Tax=Thiomonas intermedia TaxID=926 RepID=UPI0009A4E86E|nr:nuclease-related domain-containing protein [Thiomonas intermedia]
MLIKSADDKTKRLRLLEDLQASPLLDAKQRQWLKDEYWAVRNGIDGENDAAHYIDRNFINSQNHVILHDLRLVDDGQVAQIDHLIIGRAFIFYLLETKNYRGNILINDHGEFTVDYGRGQRYGIPSPIEQSKRHEAILLRVLDRLGISGRTQEKPMIKHAVLIHPKGIITRPDPKAFDTGDVIKADQFGSWRDAFVEKKLGVGATLALALNLRSLETIAEWGRMLKRQHRPRDLLDLPEFMRPREAAARGFLPTERQIVNTPPARAKNQHVQDDSPQSDGAEPKKRLICATCGAKLSFPEGKFCWNNPGRFGGLQYCRTHQADFPA